MTILQEASTKALDALRKAMQGNLDFDVALEAFEALRTALAQQELPQKERPDFMAGYDAGMADAKRMAQQGEPVAWYDEEIDCAYTATELDGGTSDGLIPLYTAAPAPHPAQTKQVLENLEQVKAT